MKPGSLSRSNSKGFTLIELLIVVAIIGILAAVAIPGYIGMQERGRKGAVTRGAESAFSELQGWLTAAKKIGIQAALTEVDTDGNGAVVIGADKTNAELASDGVVATWLATTNAAVIAQNSPWGFGPLWVRGGVAPNQGACDLIASGKPGQISLCYTPADDVAIRTIFISAADKNGNIFYSKTISVD